MTERCAGKFSGPNAWLGVAALSALFYLTQLPDFVLGGDNAEFIFGAYHETLLHPPGYPLYGWILRAASWLPWISPAKATALITAFLAAAAVGSLWWGAIAWGASRKAATVAALSFGLAPLTVHLATHAEVFSLNSLAIAAILALSGPGIGVRGGARIACLSLAGGVALTNHHTAAFMAPVGFYGLVLGMRESKRPWLHFGGSLVVSAALFLALYATLYRSAQASDLFWRWGDWSTLRGLIDHFLRRDFGTFQLAPGGFLDPLGHLTWLVESLTVNGGGVLVVLAIVALFGIARKKGKRNPAWILLAAVLSGPLFVSIFNFPLTEMGKSIVARFHLMPLLLLWVFSAGAIDALDWNRRSTPLLAISWIALLATLSAVQTSSWHSPVLEDYLTNTLESVPRHAVLLGSGEQRTFGFVYAQKVLGVRPDVVFVDGTMIKRPWYRQRIERLLGIRIDAVASSPPGPSTIDTVRLVKNLLGSGRPLFMTDILSDRIVQAFPNYPWGTSVALLSQRHPQPSPGEVYQRNRELFARFRLRDLEGPKDVWTQTALDSYSRTWRTLAEFFERGGRFREAEDCKRRLTSFDREPPFGTVSPTNLP